MEEDGTELIVSAVDREDLKSYGSNNRIFMQLRFGASDMQTPVDEPITGRFSIFESVDILQNKV